MSTFKSKISAKIQLNRPKLSTSSLRTYISVLFNISKQLNPENDSIDWFNDNDLEIMNFLENKTSQTKKTSLSALFVLTKNQSYKEVMVQVMKLVNESNKNQKKNEKQEENWISIKQIQEIYDNLLVKIKSMLAGKSILNEPIMMEWLLVSFLGGVSGLAPRRSQDYSELKIKNYDTKTDNYYKAGKFFFFISMYTKHQKSTDFRSLMYLRI